MHTQLRNRIMFVVLALFVGILALGALARASAACNDEVPSLLFDDMTLQRPTGEIPSLPFSKHPSFDQ